MWQQSVYGCFSLCNINICVDEEQFRENAAVSTSESDLVFADGDSSIGHIQSHWSPVFSVGGTNQTLDGSVQYVHT